MIYRVSQRHFHAAVGVYNQLTKRKGMELEFSEVAVVHMVKAHFSPPSPKAGVRKGGEMSVRKGGKKHITN